MGDIRNDIKEYYSQVTKDRSGEMKTHVCCCSSDRFPQKIRRLLDGIPAEIKERAYGCGSPLPPALEGCSVLDLGCGTGQDVYLAAALAGKNGRVTGIDMNEDQIAVAEKYHVFMANKYGYDNVTFLQGYIEDLSQIPDGSMDVVISNCVINLSPDKEAVFREIWRVLKTGGELYFSDIFADRRVPEDLSRDLTIRGECMGGALYFEDFRRLMRRCGWEDFRTVSAHASSIDNEEIEAMIGNIRFSSVTIRAVKLPELIEDICEQYGQVVIYKGGIEGCENYFDLDDHHRFYKDLPAAVCGNSCAMIENTRFATFFTVIGDRSIHFGPFAGCGSAPASEDCGPDCGCC